MAAGIRVYGFTCNFSPFKNEMRGVDLGKLTHRNHDKIWLVDSEIPEEESAVGIMGGINFAAEYFRLEARQEFNWRDHDVAIKGKILEEMREAWRDIGDKVLQSTKTLKGWDGPIGEVFEKITNIDWDTAKDFWAAYKDAEKKDPSKKGLTAMMNIAKTSGQTGGAGTTIEAIFQFVQQLEVWNAFVEALMKMIVEPLNKFLKPLTDILTEIGDVVGELFGIIAESLNPILSALVQG